MKIAALTISALALTPAPLAGAQDGEPLSLEHRMLLRCSAAFALVAQAQEGGVAAAREYPPLAERGKEFFVRSAAEVMESAQLDRSAIDAALRREARDLVDAGTLDEIMPVCLEALDKSGL